MSEILSGVNLAKVYNKGGKPIQVLKGLDFALEEKEFVSIMGASGAGKSTLLHLLGGLDHPTEGEVWIEGRKVNFSDDRATSHTRNRRIGFVFQFHQLLPEFTAVENASLPALVAGRRPGETREKAVEILTLLGLRDRLAHRPAEMSGGEQQRVAVARALINDPAILLLDEPTGNLDRATGEALFETLLHIREMRSLSVIMVTHNVELAPRAERTYLLEEGRIRPGDTPVAEDPWRTR